MDSALLNIREERAGVYSPEEAALMTRLRVFVTMRWLAIAGVIVATLAALLIFHVDFPTPPVYVVCVLIALYNVLLLRQVNSLSRTGSGLVVHKVRIYGNIHIYLDLLALTVLLHFTGGIENPFLFYFVFHVMLASIVLPYKRVYLLATSAILLLALLVGLEYSQILPHVNLTGFVSPELHHEPGYIAAIFASLVTILYGTAYMATAISGELRKRQREVVELRETLLHEKTKELEQSSQEIAKLAEEKSRFLRFLSIAAHDLKAPLAAIQSYIGVMLGGYSGEIGEKQRSMLERSSQRIVQLLRLISDLLDIPRIETGQLVQELKDTSLREAIGGCLEDAQKLAREKGLDFKVEMPAALPEVKASAPRLQQVINNLMSNAINYTHEGGIILRVIVRPDAVAVEVQDTGIGIPAADLPKLFDDFFRASNVDVAGTGLGLSITRRIVEAHGGKIWAESPCPENGKGTKFTFTLPIK